MILWDNDGVLVDTEPLFFEANREVLADAGVELTRARYIHDSLTLGSSMVRLARERGLDEARIAALRGARDDRYAALLGGRELLIPGVREALAALHGKVRMAIVTNARKDHFDLIHRRTGILPFFEFVLTQEDFDRSKPAPDAYLAGLARADLPADRCLVVEDTPRGLRAATAAGIPCAVIPHALTRGCDFAGAAAVLARAGDLPAFLEDWARRPMGGRPAPGARS